MPAAALLVVVEPEPELEVVPEPEVAEVVGELMLKVPFVLDEVKPVPTAEAPVPAGAGTTARVVLAGTVAGIP